MSEAARPSATELPGSLEMWIESLRRNGAWRRDPARFYYVVALSRRMEGQPEPVRALLQAKLQAAMADHAERFPDGEVPGVRLRAAAARSGASCAPLAQLNEYIRGAIAARARSEELEHEELASVRRFTQTWETSRRQDEVAQAVARKPVNAGPLNSHVLVLQSLGLMQELSPDYLRRFLVHVESLQWLESAGDKLLHQQAGQPRTARAPGRRRQSRGR